MGPAIWAVTFPAWGCPFPSIGVAAVTVGRDPCVHDSRMSGLHGPFSSLVHNKTAGPEKPLLTIQTSPNYSSGSPRDRILTQSGHLPAGSWLSPKGSGDLVQTSVTCQYGFLVLFLLPCVSYSSLSPSRLLGGLPIGQSWMDACEFCVSHTVSSLFAQTVARTESWGPAGRSRVISDRCLWKSTAHHKPPFSQALGVRTWRTQGRAASASIV